MSKSRGNSSLSTSKKKPKKYDDDNSIPVDPNHNKKEEESPECDGQDVSLGENPGDISTDEDVHDELPSSVKHRSITVGDKQEETASNTLLSSSLKTSSTSSPKTSSTSSSKTSSRCVICYLIILIGIVMYIVNLFSSSNSCPIDNDWRLKVDPHNRLSIHQQSMIRASLKPILDESSTKENDVGVSTLLILSSNEESATKLARCLLERANTKKNKDQISTEINLQSHSGGKLKLDSNLRTLLNPTDCIRAVLIRHIDNIPTNDQLEQLRLLFAYCDGENPVIPHRLIIMTATSNSENENELREKLKTRFPNEHDFIDALMSRISGHTLYVQKDQQSIC